MIFNMNESAIGGYTVNMEAVQESPYELGLEGALMHVYENECNYNALMRAVGLSEMKYYQETGKDLFVNEAGALGNFIEKAKGLFKKVIEKIAMIAKKFMAKINSYVASDKDFVKKYEKDLLRRDLGNMKFTGWKFTDFLPQFKGIPAADLMTKVGISTDAGSYEKVGENSSEQVEKDCATNRAEMIGASGELTEEEFRKQLHDKLYGEDKEEFDVNIRNAMNTITNTASAIKTVETEQKKCTEIINKFIKALEKAQSEISKWSDAEKTDTELSGKKNNAVKSLSNEIAVAKAYANDMTVAFGLMVQAKKDANRQAKAICVKALSYTKKDESAGVAGAADDIFAGVVIR